MKFALLVILLGALAGCATANGTAGASGDNGGMRTSAAMGLRF